MQSLPATLSGLEFRPASFRNGARAGKSPGLHPPRRQYWAKQSKRCGTRGAHVRARPLPADLRLALAAPKLSAPTSGPRPPLRILQSRLLLLLKNVPRRTSFTNNLLQEIGYRADKGIGRISR